MSGPTKFDSRQTEHRAALSMVGSAASDALSIILPKINDELAKLFEDKNLLLHDGGLISFDGTNLTFTESLKLTLNSKIAGGAPVVIDLTSTTRTFANNDMLYAVINRTGGTATLTANAVTLPAVTSTDQEVFLLCKRIDATDGTKRLYWRNGTAQDEGQTIRLGASGSGDGSGTANPTPAPGYKWLEFDTFSVNKTHSTTKVENTNYTNATYSAAKKIYQLTVDKTKTVAAGTTASSIVLNSAPSGFAIGDILFYNKYKRRSIILGDAPTNTIAYSDDDGVTWTGLGTSIFSTSGRAASFNGTRFVAVGSGTNTIAHSTNGTSWTGLGTSIFSTSGGGIVWNGNLFVAGGTGTNTLAYSYDGLTWVGLGTSIFSTTCKSITWTGSRFIAVGSGTNTLAYSNDGISWTGLGTSIFSTSGSQVAYGNNTVVAVGSGTNSVAYSLDNGLTWTGLTTTVFDVTQGVSVGFDGLKFIASGFNTSANSSLAYSSNGINWNVPTTGFPTTINNFNTLHFNGNNWIAGRNTNGGNNYLYYSKDGYSWTLSASSIFTAAVYGSVSSTMPYLIPAVNTMIQNSVNAAAGEWRRITNVTGSTVTVESAFSAIPTTGEIVTLSQAVWTKDLVNFGSSTERTRARDYYSGKILDCVIDYNDSLTALDDVSDKTYLNRIMVSSSNSGLADDTGLPTSDKFRATYIRPIRSEIIQKHTLYTNTTQERLFLCFFADPYNPDVSSTCNMLNYSVSFYGDDSSINSGVLEDAICFSDNSTTPHNCSVSTASSQTSVILDWSFIPNLRNGESQVEVFVDGKRVNKFISAVKTPTTDLYFTEAVDGSGLYKKITFNADLSVTPLEIKIVKRFGVIQDISSGLSSRVGQFFDFVVGSSAQVIAGIATHTTLTDAITAASSGQNILILNNITITDSPTVNKKLMIVGKGNGSSITGNLTVTSAGAKSTFSDLRIDGNITFQASADYCFMTNCFQSTGKTFSNDVSNVNNSLDVITE